MSELQYLPRCAGIYFAVEEGGTVVYIGQSVNIYNRWRAHNIQQALCDLSDLEAARRVRLAWLEVSDLNALSDLEEAFIRKFRPRLNDSYNRTHPTALPAARLITTNEAAERLGVSVRRVRALITAGKLEAQQLGREYAIEESALARVTVYGKAGRPKKIKDRRSALP